MLLLYRLNYKSTTLSGSLPPHKYLRATVLIEIAFPERHPLIPAHAQYARRSPYPRIYKYSVRYVAYQNKTRRRGVRSDNKKHTNVNHLPYRRDLLPCSMAFLYFAEVKRSRERVRPVYTDLKVLLFDVYVVIRSQRFF